MRILALDHGTKRIGVAVSDETNTIALPLEYIPAEPFAEFLVRLKQILAEKEVDFILVGMPRNMDGTFGPAAQKAREFIEALKLETTCRVVPWDERLTTVSAQRSLHEAGKNAKAQKAMIDQVAAQILLQSWLDSQV